MKIFIHIARTMFTISIPVFLMMTSIRLMFTPVFLMLEYAMPGFPDDSFGFSTGERLEYANISLDYIIQPSADLTMLSSLAFDDGSPLYTERELSHMLDVRIVFQRMVYVHYFLLALLIGISVYAHYKRSLTDYWILICKGGWWTIGFIVFIFVAIAVSFNNLFTTFHKLFFTGDSWLFLWSDTLIRLFPPRLWQDGFIGAGGLTLVLALLFALGGNRLSKR